MQQLRNFNCTSSFSMLNLNKETNFDPQDTYGDRDYQKKGFFV